MQKEEPTLRCHRDRTQRGHRKKSSSEACMERNRQGEGSMQRDGGLVSGEAEGTWVPVG